MKKISTIKPFYFKVPLGTTVVTIIGPAAAEKTKNVVTTEASARRCGFESHHCHHKMNNRIFFSKIKKTSSSFPYLFQTEISQRNYLGSNNIHKNRIPTGQWMHKGIYGKKYSLFTIGACSL